MEEPITNNSAVQPEKKPMDRRVLILAAFLVVVVGGGIAAGAYLLASHKSVYIEKSQIEAPQVTLAPKAAGKLQKSFVAEGDLVPANTVVAQVGVELIKTTAAGLVVKARTDIGTQIQAGEPVVTLVDPSALRVVGQLAEDKGLIDVSVGDRAYFTVDAFGGEKFDGVVDEVSPISNAGDVVFSISDKREVQNFNVKVKYDTAAHPELRNGMSAKIWVYKQ